MRTWSLRYPYKFRYPDHKRRAVRLLVVEDDSAIREFLNRGLTEAGYRVDAAANAKSALALAAEEVHDGFIIDLGLARYGWARLNWALPSSGSYRSRADFVGPPLGR